MTEPAAKRVTFRLPEAGATPEALTDTTSTGCSTPDGLTAAEAKMLSVFGDLPAQDLRADGGDRPRSTWSAPAQDDNDIKLDVLEDPEAAHARGPCARKPKVQWAALLVLLVGGVVLGSRFAPQASAEGGATPIGPSGGCLAAETLLWQVPCTGGAKTAVAAQDVPVGACVLDANGAPTEVYYRASSVEDQVVLGVGDNALALTPGHLVITPGGLRPAGALEVGAALGDGAVDRVEQTRGPVALVYTLSGSLLAGELPVSCYEHWTDPWLSTDTRLLYQYVGPHAVTHAWYRAYFDLESSVTDPWVHWLLPH